MSLVYIVYIGALICVLRSTQIARAKASKISGLPHCGWVTHICVNKLTSIGWDNGLSPCRRQAIISTNAGILLIRTSGTNFSEIFSEFHIFLFMKMHLKMSSGQWWPFWPRLSVLNHNLIAKNYHKRKYHYSHMWGYIFISHLYGSSLNHQIWTRSAIQLG